MQIQLMRYDGERIRANKSAYLTNKWACEGSLKTAVSILEPRILIEKQTPPTDTQYNYLYIPAFKRYYYIKDIVNDTLEQWEIIAEVDAVFSWLQDVLNTKCIIDKTEGFADANLYLNDGSFVMDSHKYNQVVQFPYGLSEQGNNILICSGG